MDTFVGSLGRKTIRSVNHILDLCALTYRILILMFKRQKTGGVTVRRVIMDQIYFTCVEALPIVIPIALLIGSMLIVQFSKVSGQYDLGRTTVILLVRELGPICTAFLVILRSGTAVTIEIGYMNVLHEIDAFEMAGIDPIRIICLPRLIGITSAVFCLFIVFDLVSIIGGYGLVWIITHIPLGNFLEQIGKAITGADIAVGIVKALCFGVIITVTSLIHGFNIKRNITEIPMGTSKAAIESVIYCLIANIIISAVFYL